MGYGGGRRGEGGQKNAGERFCVYKNRRANRGVPTNLEVGSTGKSIWAMALASETASGTDFAANARGRTANKVVALISKL